jgi:hypothetical protein
MERLADRRTAITAAAMKALQASGGDVLGLRTSSTASGGGGGDVEEGLSASASSCHQLAQFCAAAVDAFFDNDLIRTSRMFLKSSRGSFGLCISSSLVGRRIDPTSPKIRPVWNPRRPVSSNLECKMIEGLGQTFRPLPVTRHPKSQILNPRCTLNPDPQPLNAIDPTPYTLHPTPYTLHPTPYPLHPTP